MMTDTDYQIMSQQVRPLVAQNRWAFFEFFLQLFLLGLGFYWSSLSTPFWFIGQIILGISFWRSFAILHSCGHDAFFNVTWLNTFTGYFQSLFCYIPYYSWKYIHQDHHVWTGWQDLDPTTKNLDKKPNDITLKILDFCWKFWIPIISLHYILSVFFRPNSPSLKHPQRSRLRIISSIVWVIAVHAIMIFFLSWKYFQFFALSGFIYLNFGDISLLTQHVHLPLDHSKGVKVKPKKLHEQDQYSHTMTLPPFVSRWIFLNFNHHALHHLYPGLPYYFSHEVKFEGVHTQSWKNWVPKAKSMKASELIFEKTVS